MTGFDPRAGRPSFAWLNPESCISDARYQRPTDGNRSARLIAKIEQEFNWSKFAAVVVTDNGDGTYAVLDGQHRVAAALRHPKVFEIPALIMDTETLVEQAEAFLGVNRDRVLTNKPTEHYARLAARDPDAMEINRVCKEADVEIARTVRLAQDLKPNETLAIASIGQAIRKYGNEPTVRALKAIRAAYPDRKGELRAGTIKATAELIYLHKADIDDARLAQTLSTKPAKDRDEAARSYKANFGGSTVLALRKALERDYNGIPGGKKLKDPGGKAK